MRKLFTSLLLLVYPISNLSAQDFLIPDCYFDNAKAGNHNFWAVNLNIEFTAFTQADFTDFWLPPLIKWNCF